MKFKDYVIENHQYGPLREVLCNFLHDKEVLSKDNRKCAEEIKEGLDEFFKLKEVSDGK